MNKIWFLPLILLIMLAGCTPRRFSLLPRASLLILSHHLEKGVGEDTVQITGVARNNSAAELQYAEVIGKFYDKAGTLLHSGVDSTINLSPGQTWEFTISVGVHPALNILSYYLKKDSSGARIIGEAENNGDVMLSFAEITGTFYCTAGELASGTATTLRLGVGEIWEFTIFYPRSNYEIVSSVRAEVNEDELDCEPIEGVDDTTVQVGALRGSTVMP